ncbi:glycoside hydrolase family 3 C-terminal domain-containing protein [Paenibacillus sp. GSMTC-2017]|uniref:glycoside hydrolase family 3 protein n=1 Tax=Paenibacillus sp. GSMTC-2017 TaxID=2794350 RepID=UPI0018D749C2|nr:glycoside hydrolase family 3 protein [Paenibacillus sp. GSMTC-2017]MBH5318295.1 glycoside hydrolase family 3 C-terminal domain-containing protein [Paenibacillus sp. GSMTC-2017]
MKKKVMFWVATFTVIAAVILVIAFNTRELKEPTGSANTTVPSATPTQSDVASHTSIEDKVKDLIAKMNDKEKIGQLVMYTPDYQASAFSSGMVKEYGVGSVLLNRRTKDALETTQFINQLQEWATDSRLGIPLLISGDMEYGAAQRVPGEATVLPRQMAIGATQNTSYAQQAAEITADEAKAMGFNWSFSPVSDVNSNKSNPVIGVRSFGEDPKMVSEMAVAQVKGYQNKGILSSAKHFPGHGDTGFDSHSTLSTVSYSEEVLRNVHLVPFKAVIDQGIESIMTAHIILEAIDPDLPATLSKKVLTGLLREELGFQGIIVTDAMVMDAISKNWDAGEAAVMAINAGADIVMANGSQRDQSNTLKALEKALKEGKLDRTRVDASVERILTHKFKLKLFENRLVDEANATEVVGSSTHMDLAKQIAIDSITLIKNEGILPFDAASEETTLVVSAAYAGEIAESVNGVSKGKVISYQVAPAQGEKLDASDSAIATALKEATHADRIIVATFSDRELSAGQVKLVTELIATGKPVVTVSLGNPSDILSYPGARANIATYALDNWYWITPIPVSWEAAIQVVFGTKPKGKLPITLSEEYPRGFGLSYP